MPNTNRRGISTHVLDITRGEPAAGVPVILSRIDAGRPVVQSSLVTDADGRIADLLGGDVRPGSYQIVFDVAAYFGRRGDTPCVFSRVALNLELADGDRGYHIPLLVSPYSCASYRGS